ncbi:MAG TPA: methyltransferase domain-containing protein [Bryobacteraceae bacterium]|nr:methyltransferase domain-containing protein [Bryobacteraceae bacterium]
MSAQKWDSALYDDRHSFVWRAGAGLLDLLNPQPHERILDLGCGTGHLTAKIAEVGAVAVGLDSSPAMIAQARQNFPSVRFVLAEARDFRFEEAFDAVFSNAVLHWIHDAESVVKCVAAALRSGGRFVLEMGARGNVESIRKMLEEVLTESGRAPKSPWFYPSAGEYSTLLEKHGFEIRTAQTFERWTKLEHPDRGLREWLEMFAGSWFEGISATDRASLIATVEDRLRPTLYKDGSWWADYRRLRLEAVK